MSVVVSASKFISPRTSIQCIGNAVFLRVLAFSFVAVTIFTANDVLLGQPVGLFCKISNVTEAATACIIPYCPTPLMTPNQIVEKPFRREDGKIPKFNSEELFSLSVVKQDAHVHDDNHARPSRMRSTNAPATVGASNKDWNLMLALQRTYEDFLFSS